MKNPIAHWTRSTRNTTILYLGGLNLGIIWVMIGISQVLHPHSIIDFELAGTLEPRPGLEPSPTHISGLIPRMKSEGVKLVIIETFRPRRTPERVANDAGAKLLVLPSSVGGAPQAKDYFGLLDYDVAQIAKALGAK